MREADPNDTFTFSIEKVIKQLRDKPKFTGVGKTPSQELFKLFGNIKVALDTVDAPSEYSSILDLDREETYSGRVNKHLYVILYNITEDSAASIVEQSASDSDGRQAWKALNHQYLPVDSLGRAELLTAIYQFKVGPGPPDKQLDKLHRQIETLNKVSDHPISHQYKVDAYLSSLARADNSVYGDLVTALNSRTFAGVDNITLNEIRVQSSSAFTNAKARDKITRERNAAAALLTAQSTRPPPKVNIKKAAAGTKKTGQGNTSEPPQCQFCKAAGVVANHWHSTCARNPSAKNVSSSITKKANFEELEE